MKTVKVIIEETVSQEFEVVVADADEEKAIDIAIQKYKNEEFILEPGKIQYRQIAVSNPENMAWIQF